MTLTSSDATQGRITLPPSFWLPLGIFAIGLAFIFLGNSLLLGSKVLSLIALLLGIMISLFSFFLMVQMAIIRLTFTETALEVYRSEKMIRRFPYSDWQNWKIFWSKIPILFYFKEVNSIHFLPIIFNAKMLKECLENRCPLTEINQD